jgi:hypothetical protein
MNRKLEIGQILYRKPTKSSGEITEYVVTKIGRKNFEVDKFVSREGKFVIESLRYEHPNYSQFNFQLYTSKEGMMEEVRLAEMTAKIQGYFRGYGRPELTLEQAEAIIKILFV